MKKPVATCEDTAVILAWMKELRSEFTKLHWTFHEPTIESRTMATIKSGVTGGVEVPFVHMESDDDATYMQSINNEPHLQFSVSIDYYSDTGQIVICRAPNFRRITIGLAHPDTIDIIKNTIQNWMILADNAFTIPEEDMP